jgi:DNA polymerase-3 subunit beta
MANPDDKGQAELPADTDGEGKVRVNGSYLASVLKACGGMVDFKLTTPISPMLFASNGYQVVVMPMMTEEAKKQAQAESKAEATTAEPTKPKKKGKGKGKGKTEPEPTEETEPEPVTA